ncbi:MAG: hypothetical protein L7F77_14945 [Candidatus Magnetominusculus sp. LBB02]|nr:hypothetical protein [Candidatus Magnetominusculus sp. LBB02]
MKALEGLFRGFKSPAATTTGGQSLTVCYAKKAGCEFYKISKAGISVALNGKTNKFMGKNVLVLSRELVFYWREKYPPLQQKTQKNLKGIISNDLAEMFPMIAAPAFHYNIFESHANYTLVDIWAWESRDVEALAKEFPLNYLIPEDLLFVSAQMEATIYAEGEKVYAIAHGPNGFIGSRSLAIPLTESGIEVFLRSLGACWQEIKRLNLCGMDLPSCSAIMDIPINAIKDEGYPISLKGLNSFKLAPFSTRSWQSAVDKELLFRIVVYSMAAYTASSWLSMRKLDMSIEDIERETAKASKRITELAELQDKDVTAKLLVALAKKVGDLTPPLDVIEVLSRVISDGSHVTQLNINNRNVDVNLVSADPSGVINKLSTIKEVETVKLMGEPTREGQSYKFRLSLEMRDTISTTNANNASSTAFTAAMSAPPAAITPQAAVGKTSVPAAIMNANPNAVAAPSANINRASSPSALMKTNKLF